GVEPGGLINRTAEEGGVPQLVLYRQLAQQVKSKEATDVLAWPSDRGPGIICLCRPDHAQRRVRYVRSLWRFGGKEYAQHPSGQLLDHVQAIVHQLVRLISVPAPLSVGGGKEPTGRPYYGQGPSRLLKQPEERYGGENPRAGSRVGRLS